MKDRFREIIVDAAFSSSARIPIELGCAVSDCETLTFEMMEKFAFWIDKSPYFAGSALEGTWGSIHDDEVHTTEELITKFLSENK
jgi:hypothetical protein